ncbi:MAG: redox-regulated ATPase YchF [candidate division WOR-3 bacterium]|nr:MAG: redox-regulated ATPase YchF [candidate division WOR-3 bacterium]
MRVGIIGLPNVGKSSLFNLLTNAGAQVANFPFTTIDRNVGMVMIPDERMEKVVEITKSPRMRYAAIEVVDIAGLIKDAHKGEGLGNKFLSHIRDVDLIVHILRCFSAPDVAHVSEQLSPGSDYSIVRTELLLADLEIIERRIEKIKKAAEFRDELDRLIRMKEEVSKGRAPAEVHGEVPLLTTKQEIVVLNLDDEGKFKNGVDGYRISVKLEGEIAEFTEDERIELRKDAGVDINGPAGLIKHCLDKLSIILFYTIKGDEARAWPVPQGTTVFEAAGKIHTDMQKGFIKAEVLSCHDFFKAGGFAEAQNLGCTKIEGRDYILHDGEIVLIKFRG